MGCHLTMGICPILWAPYTPRTYKLMKEVAVGNQSVDFTLSPHVPSISPGASAPTVPSPFCVSKVVKLLQAVAFESC